MENVGLTFVYIYTIRDIEKSMLVGLFTAFYIVDYTCNNILNSLVNVNNIL